jgi:dienelactone hydrolase
MMDDTNEKAVSADTGSGKGRLVRIAAEAVSLSGILNIPAQAHGLVILAHGIDAAVENPHQNIIALSDALNQLSLATLQVDLFSSDERAFDQHTEYFRQNLDIMQQRIVGTAQWFTENPGTDTLSIGYFGIDEVGAAALIAAAERPDMVAAVVAAGQHADLAQSYISRVLAPTLLLAAEKDTTTIATNQQLFSSLQSEKQSERIPGASAIFESDQAFNEVTRIVGDWFARWLVTVG